MTPNSKSTNRKTPAKRKRGVRLDARQSDTIFLRLRPVGFELAHTIDLVLDLNGDAPKLSIGCESFTFADWRGKRGDEVIEDEYGIYDPEPTEDDEPGTVAGASDETRAAWLRAARRGWAARRRANERTLARWRAIRDDLVADAERIATTITAALGEA